MSWIREKLSDKSTVRFATLGLVALLLLGYAYFELVAPTRIGLVGYPDSLYAGFLKANENPFIDVERIRLGDEEDAPNLEAYRAVYFWGHGLTISEEQRESIRQAAESGVKVFLHASTNPESDLTNLRGEELDYVSDYLKYGGSKNLRALFNYTRRVFDGKTLFTDEVVEPAEIPFDAFFHMGADDYFETLEAYQAFYEKKGLYKEGAPTIALATTTTSPRSPSRSHLEGLVRSLEDRGFNVYPISGFAKRLDLVKALAPDLVVFIPHGRFASGRVDEAIQWLKERNVPLLSPLSVNAPYEEWVESQQGMMGGMLSQSVTMPELDGGIVPYVLFAQFKDENGLYVLRSIPERVETFTDLVERWVNLKAKPNAEKKLAIYYYKGAGKNAMVAGGMEVAASLLEILKRLRGEGYTTGELPATEEEMVEIINERGPLLGTYAEGTTRAYFDKDFPEWVDAETYLEWCREELEPEMIADMERLYGPAPGSYLTEVRDDHSRIAVTRVAFGNVVALPQPAAAYGEDEFKLVHGQKLAPPHPYVASYLWVKRGLEADAVIHLGTHGSFEFTPWKQVALSQLDWPDALIGGMPHLYVYVINNIGEAIIAKRRSYPALVSHLTPPFTESGVYGELEQLNEKMEAYLGTNNEALKAELLVSIRTAVLGMELHKDLGIEAVTEETLERIHDHLHSIEETKVNRGLYTLGVPYAEGDATETARLMAIDALAYSSATVARLRGEVSPEQLENAHFFDDRFRVPAISMLDGVLLEGRDPASFLRSDDRERLERWNAEHASPRQSPMGQERKPSSPEPDQDNELTTEEKDQVEKLLFSLGAAQPSVEPLRRLTDADVFQTLVPLLDVKSHDKAERFAALDPEIQQQLDLLARAEMRDLLRLMKKPGARRFVAERLTDADFLEPIAEARKRWTKEVIAASLQEERVDDLAIAMNRLRAREALESFSAERIERFQKNLGFYLEHARLADAIGELGTGNAVAVAAVLSSAASRERIETAIEAAAQATQRLEDREEEYVEAIRTHVDALANVKEYRAALLRSTSLELDALVNGLDGGFIAPSSGGDPIVNPDSIPAGRNMYSIDAERMPSEEAWKVGKKLADALLAAKLRETGEYPRKVAFTLWSSEFVNGQGMNIAEILYLLGTEPVRNSRGTVHDVRLISIEELGRPRIDVVVQTSGQFRDLAASRLYLIDKAVELASREDDGETENFVTAGTLAAESVMKQEGLAPAEARALSTARIFGAVNGGYGTGIMPMVESGDSWEDDQEIEAQYLKNMGAVYTRDHWSVYRPGVFEAALQNTDTVVQPRSSNTWGPLSLDHIYEFMGGINIAVRNVTGRDPDSYFNDMRNPHNPIVQNAREAIWVEARSTLYNPKFIRELMEGGASSAEVFAETFRNTFGWNAMKPSIIEERLWDELYDVYVEDKHDLGVEAFFRDKNPYALQEMTAVMLETVRKGYWAPGDSVVKTLARLHATLIREFGAGCSGFVCDNQRLRELIASSLEEPLRVAYEQGIETARVGSSTSDVEGMTLDAETSALEKASQLVKDNLVGVVTLLGIVGIFCGAVLFGATRKRA